MEDFINLHGISRSELDLADKNKPVGEVTKNKRNSKFVRSDALSPNSVNRLIIETELEKINRRNINKAGSKVELGEALNI